MYKYQVTSRLGSALASIRSLRIAFRGNSSSRSVWNDTKWSRGQGYGCFVSIRGGTESMGGRISMGGM